MAQGDRDVEPILAVRGIPRRSGACIDSTQDLLRVDDLDTLHLS